VLLWISVKVVAEPLNDPRSDHSIGFGVGQELPAFFLSFPLTQSEPIGFSEFGIADYFTCISEFSNAETLQERATIVGHCFEAAVADSADCLRTSHSIGHTIGNPLFNGAEVGQNHESVKRFDAVMVVQPTLQIVGAFKYDGSVTIAELNRVHIPWCVDAAAG